MKHTKPKVKTKEKVKSKEKTDIIAVPRRKTQKKFKEQKKTGRELKRFASFPQLNPNPVLEVDSSGKIIFCNDAAMQTLQELKLNDMNLFLPADIRNILSDLEQKKESQFYREVTIGEKIFGEALYLAPQFNSMRIYASDITVRKRMEEELRKSRDELEILVKERTAELLQTSERLKKEIEERVRTEQSLRLEESRLEALFCLSQISDSSTSEVSGFILEKGIALTGSKIGFVGFLSGDEAVYTLNAVSKDVVKECNVTGNPMQWHVLNAGIWADAIRERRTLFVNDYSKPYPNKKGLPQGHPYVERFMVVPLFEGKRIVAVAGVGNKATDYEDPDERQIVLLLTGLWNYVQKDRSRQTLQEAHDKLERRVEQRTAELTASNAALRESERRLARSQEIAHLGSWELDLVNNHLFWSDEVYRIFGLHPQEFNATYDAFLEAVHPDDRTAVDEAYSRSLREGRDSYEIEHRVVRKSSGEVCIVYEKCEHIRDESGRIIRSIGMLQDITVRKRLEEELNKYTEHLETLVKKRTEELSKAYREFEAFFNYSITPLVFLDRDFNFIRVNEAYAITCQRVISDFPGRNHFELFPDEENKAIFRRVVETKIPYQAIAKPFSFPEHSELVTYWDWTLTPVLDKHGEVDFFVFSLNDVTKKKLAEEELINERQRFYDVLEMLPAYLVLLTPNYHVAFANRFFREHFGESLGLRCFEYLFGRTEPCEICETYKVLKTGLPQRWEWTGPDDRNYDIYDFPFTDIDGSPLIMEMGIDITERKKAEDALRMNEKKYRSLIEQAADGIVILDKWLNIKDVNPAICRMSGYSVEELSGLNVKTLILSQDLTARPLPLDLLFAGETVLEERQVFRKDGSLIDVEASAKMLEDGNIQVIARDITERKDRESRDRLITSLLELFAKKESRKGYLDAVVQLIHEWSNCRCVGIRVVNEYGYIPYESYAGFNPEFIKLENMLSLNNDMCACVRTVTGQFEQQDKSVLTPNGSFCINNSLEFADRLTQKELAMFRGNCIRTGFLSIALIPVRYRGRAIGLIHLADGRQGMVPFKVIEFIETISSMIGEAVFRFNTEDELKNSREQLRKLFAHLQSTREQERTQIAQEIHDEFGAVLTGLKVDLSSLEKKMPAERELVQERLRADLKLVDSAVQIVRRISSELRPSVLEHLGLTAAIEWQVKEFGNRSGISWDISIDIKDIDLDKDLSTAVFRIFQESLVNIMRHAEATAITVNLQERDGILILEVIDNGKGIPEEKLSDHHSFGLMGIKERVQYLGGELEIKGIPNKGTAVTVKIPVKSKEAE